jgi:Tn3 transposase DDE domain
MEIQRHFVDSHGQSEVAFAFFNLLNFELAPRPKAIARQKLYLPDTGLCDRLGDLAPVQTRALDWDLIERQYDEMIKYTAALRRGTARRSAGSAPRHVNPGGWANIRQHKWAKIHGHSHKLRRPELTRSCDVRKLGRKSTDRVLGPKGATDGTDGASGTGCGIGAIECLYGSRHWTYARRPQIFLACHLTRAPVWQPLFPQAPLQDGGCHEGHGVLVPSVPKVCGGRPHGMVNPSGT